MNAGRDVHAHFLLGAFRSGTTALCHALRLASNALVLVEDPPKMCRRARQAYDGRPEDTLESILRDRAARVQGVAAEGLLYVDKNPNYLHFVDALHERFGSRFVFAFRDGRDVVRSMMDWHDVQGKALFTLPEDGGVGPPADPGAHGWDLSLLRPRNNEPARAVWASWSRFEHCAWYWSRYNELGLNMAERLGPDVVLLVDMTRAKADGFRQVFDFLGLSGFDEERVAGILQERVNSVTWRSGKQDRFPPWQHWTADERARFDALAGRMMARLGYA